MVCNYHSSGKSRQIILDKEEIKALIQKLSNMHKCLKSVFTIFYVDHIVEIQKYHTFDTDKLRKEALVLNLVSSLATQGFYVMDLYTENSISKMIVQDKIQIDTLGRAAHSSQFIMPLWEISRFKRVIIEYRDKKGKGIYRFVANYDLCEGIFNEKIHFNELAKNMKIEKLGLDDSKMC